MDAFATATQAKVRARADPQAQRHPDSSMGMPRCQSVLEMRQEAQREALVPFKRCQKGVGTVHPGINLCFLAHESRNSLLLAEPCAL